MQSSSDSGDSIAQYRALSPVSLRRNSISGGRLLRQVRRFAAVCLQLRCRDSDFGMRPDRLSASWMARERSSLTKGVEDIFPFSAVIILLGGLKLSKRKRGRTASPKIKAKKRSRSEAVGEIWRSLRNMNATAPPSFSASAYAGIKNPSASSDPPHPHHLNPGCSVCESY